MNRPSRVGAIAGVFVVLLLTGCQTNEPTPKETAAQQWNTARAKVMLGVAQEQYQSGNFEKSRQTVDEALKLAPNTAPLYVLSAKIHIEQGRLEAAEQHLQAARQLTPNDGEAWYLSGVVYQRWQRPAEALTLYRTASEKSPAELAYLLAWSEMLVASDQPTEALALLQEKVAYFEHSATIRDAVGQLLQQLGRHAEAVAVFRQASILAEEDMSIRERMGMAMYYSKDYRSAAEVLERLAASEAYAQRADVITVLAECQFRSGKVRESRRTFETATQLDATSSAAWRGLGRSALELQDLKRAELAFARAIKVDPALAETHLMHGYVMMRQEKHAEALRSFQTASLLSPDDTVAICMVGLTYEKLGRGEDAIRQYARALKMKPGDDMAARLMASVNLHDE